MAAEGTAKAGLDTLRPEKAVGRRGQVARQALRRDRFQTNTWSRSSQAWDHGAGVAASGLPGVAGWRMDVSVGSFGTLGGARILEAPGAYNVSGSLAEDKSAWDCGTASAASEVAPGSSGRMSRTWW